MNLKQTQSILFAIIPLLIGIQSCTDTTGKIEAQETPEIPPNSEVAGVKSESETPQEPADPLAQFDREKTDKLTETAKLLAGLKTENSSAIADLQKSKNWNDHSYALNSAWTKLEAQQLSKVRKWSDTELKSIHASTDPIFYPFSGPDFLYVYSLFPKSPEYIMVGLEPVGQVPDLASMSEPQKTKQLKEVEGSLSAILKFSFFRTKDMEVDLDRQGVLPLLFVFMARTNNKILDVEYIGLDKDAKIQIRDEATQNPNGMIPGAKITFVPEGGSQPQTLYYFSTDLSDSGLQQTPQFTEFVTQMETPVTYLKAASYLMHRENFSTVRNLVLSKSDILLQDDSGIPVNAFNPDDWNLKFYGTYVQPIDLFKARYQPDLRKIYQTDSSIKPLDFGIGYKYYEDSNLMLATKKDTQSNP